MYEAARGYSRSRVNAGKIAFQLLSLTTTPGFERVAASNKDAADAENQLVVRNIRSLQRIRVITKDNSLIFNILMTVFFKQLVQCPEIYDTTRDRSLSFRRSTESVVMLG